MYKNMCEVLEEKYQGIASLQKYKAEGGGLISPEYLKRGKRNV